MASKKIKIEGSKGKATQGEGKSELLRVEVGGLRAKASSSRWARSNRRFWPSFRQRMPRSGDRTGLLVGDPAAPVRAVAVALDLTWSFIDAAADAGANVLVTHHPAYLTPPTSFQPASSPALNSGAVVYRAIQRGVALMNFHTALDVSASRSAHAARHAGAVAARVVERRLAAPRRATASQLPPRR